MKTKRSTAKVQWNGTLEGRGKLTTQSGVLNKELVTWKARSEDLAGTNPEEMLAAAHATCFAMSLADKLDDAGYLPTQLDVTATCLLEKQEFGGVAIREMDLGVVGRVPGISAAKFAEIAEKAEEHSPVTRALTGNVSIYVNAHLQGATPQEVG